MRTGHNAVAAAKVPGVNNYRLERKAAAVPPMGGAPELAPPGAPDPGPTPEAMAQTHEWAGDLYEQGDQSDPGRAFARFEGVDGESAWLDRADDGTLTGWVQDADGSVYRYSDDGAWAIDVDQAGMSRTDVPSDAGDAGEPVEDQGGEPVEGEDDEPLADGESDPGPDAGLIDPAELEDESEADADALADAVDEGFAEGGADLPEEGEPVDDEPVDGEEPDPEEEDEDDPLGLESKSWPVPGGGTFVIRPQENRR